MSGIFGETLTLSQANGPDISLVVNGDEFYAEYETPEGYAVVYDRGAGLYCYATLDAGRYQSTGVPAAGPPPPGLSEHLKESPEARREKRAARRAGSLPPNGHP